MADRKYAVLQNKESETGKIVIAINREAEEALNMFQTAPVGSKLMENTQKGGENVWMEFKVIATR